MTAGADGTIALPDDRRQMLTLMPFGLDDLFPAGGISRAE